MRAEVDRQLIICHTELKELKTKKKMRSHDQHFEENFQGQDCVGGRGPPTFAVDKFIVSRLMINLSTLKFRLNCWWPTPTQ